MARKPTFLTPVEIPEYCFLSEALAWIALGRVPEAQITLEPKTYRPKEWRFYWREMPDNFEAPGGFWGFDESEFQANGLTVPEGYFEALEVYFENSLDQTDEMIRLYQETGSRAEANGDSDLKRFSDEHIAKELATASAFHKEKQMVEAVARDFEGCLDLGWAKLFQLIREGTITLEAMDERE